VAAVDVDEEGLFAESPNEKDGVDTEVPADGFTPNAAVKAVD